MQLILVAILIAWPGSVTYWLDKKPTVDPATIEIDIPRKARPPREIR
jgi:hypothetical protein